MNFAEWVIALVVILGVVVGLKTASDWQQEGDKGGDKERVQQQTDMILQRGELFPVSQTLKDIPDNIKKERCKQSKECFKLVEALVYEARSETRKGQIAVASVILNRVEHKKFPDTIQGVITQPHQFSYLKNMHKQRKPTAKDWDKAFIVAYDVKHGIVERVSDATFYLNPKTVKRTPRWVLEYEYVMTVDNHKFYRYN